MAELEDITIEQGSAFSWTFTAKNAAGTTLDVSGGTAKMQARPAADHPVAYLDIATGTGITLGSSGQVTVALTGAQTGALLAPKELVYDLFVTLSGGAVHRVMAGNLSILARVTRP